jgi:DNA-binding CsgD family transcriptional regulator
MADLSPRERQVLALVAEARSDKEIASALGIHHHTVKVHVLTLRKKIGARNRVEAAVMAVKNEGLLT